ncbi:Homeodomain-like [Phytophthora cactorum]|nr:Homeodomain-like [Phytophthora cactorum]
MERRGVGKRLTDGQRVEILKLFQSGAAVTEADVARRYGVTRSAIWRLRRSGQHILERYQEGDVQSRDERRRGAKNSSGSNRSVVTSASSETFSAPAFVVPSTSPLRPIPTPCSSLQPSRQNQPNSSRFRAGGGRAANLHVGQVHRQRPIPGLLNWERLSGHGDEEVFEVVNDGISVLQEGNYQINVDLQHSQPRQNYKVVFKVWHDRTLLAQCSCPLRTKKEISLSLLELRCQLPALAKLRVEFLAPGFAFHESRIALRLVQ